ncbi:MAG TPA: quinoprotein dehydrogenase-associated putative ABC transporter substrate-binding protein [Terriglobales bacterium]
MIISILFAASFGFAQENELKVCADPHDLPFSNQKQQGFENKIAELVAQDLHANLHYVWQRMGKGFVREYIDNSTCDLLIGIPAGYRALLTTAPYYRSTYVFVVARNQKLVPVSLNDPVLREMKKIGVQVLDDDYTPPAEALARRGMQQEIVGFQTLGAGASKIMGSVAQHKIDSAIVWGPFAGYYVKRFPGTLLLNPVSPEVDPPGLPFTFAISMGVRKGNTELKFQLEQVLERRRQDIRRILENYGVPQLALVSQTPTSE